jgi:exodeoxyribonuclease VII large subunit
VLRVSELTEAIQGLLETEFFDVWVEGEISNLKFASSGHWYFSLKDEHASIRAVVWKMATRLIRFRPKDGLKVRGRGSVRVYAPRGEYQISLEVLEPVGKGSLQQAYEDLKERLAKEGLFEQARKRPLPMLPRCLGIISSPTGAVIRDILRVLRTRHRNVDVLVYPARVQGPEAAGEIAAGLRALNRLGGLDVIILARGGGSLEDLWPFNEEGVARALAASTIPTIAAIGHETDVTIADFVADLRAPTPSAAALYVVKAKDDLLERLGALDARAAAALRLRVERIRARVRAVTSHRVFEAERGRVRAQAQRTDELVARAALLLARRRDASRTALRGVAQRLERFRFDRQLAERRRSREALQQRLLGASRAGLEARRGALARLAGKLESLSPVAVLARGYALVWNEDGTRLIRRAADAAPGDAIRVRVHEGTLHAVVRDKENG